jgi:hypothetical protein
MEEGAERSIRRVLPLHEIGSEYLEGTAKEIEVVMCDWPGLRNEKSYPLSRNFTKHVLIKTSSYARARAYHIIKFILCWFEGVNNPAALRDKYVL